LHTAMDRGLVYLHAGWVLQVELDGVVEALDPGCAGERALRLSTRLTATAVVQGVEQFSLL
ncbi:MAG: hypothetical protein ABW074_12865, partial [Sedimenticola sp.]